MKRLLLIIVISLFLAPVANVFANTNSFYFSNASFDYYLSKNEKENSTMRVEEELTAVFPSIDQNHGIERCIPSSYQGIKTLNTSSLSVTRNGTSEPFSTYSENNVLCLRIGRADTYVHGEQTYKISYELGNVILNPDNSQYQELYWDTNGTGWAQPFYSLTTNIHLSDNVIDNFTGETSCYVGSHGASGSGAMSRCKTNLSENNTLITFSTKNLAPGENLTFNLVFLPNSFHVEKKKPNYLPIISAILALILIIYSFILWKKAYTTIREKKSLAKDKACPVQYIPPKNLSVAEAGTVYLKNVSSLQVASLMELAVKHHIELEKGEKKFLGGHKWKIHTKNLDNIPEEQKIVLEILNGGKTVGNDSTIEIKKHSYSSKLESLGRKFTTILPKSLEEKHLFADESEKKQTKSGLAIFISVLSVFAIIITTMLVGYALSETVFMGDSYNSIYSAIYELLILSSILISFIYIITITCLSASLYKYNKRTIEGIKTSKYLDGLKEYMKLAEKERIKFLQSVNGAELSHQNIVRLYEKLLPYAVLFNLEDSWLAEMNKYYEMDDVTNPNWMLGSMLLSTRDFNSFTTYTSSVVASSTASYSSSSSSGGGGGGFSGGGGGGGGGGGW